MLKREVTNTIAIEASEKRGQEELVASELLPMDLRRCDEAFEKLGFVLGAAVEDDPLFRHATFPKGWTRAATDHPMWSEIRDAEGRVRVMVFYKAAIYDRSAHARIERRFTVSGYSKRPATVIDRKTQSVLFTSDAADDSVAYDACSKWLRKSRPLPTSGGPLENALAIVAEWEDAPVV